MSVTSAQVTTLLENVLFESATLAAQNAPSWTAIANLNTNTSTVAGLSAYLATQPEAQIAERVVEYYQGALARVPSAFEISYYVAQAEAGLNATQISQGTAGVSLATWQAISNEFAASSEFKADFGLTGGITAANAGLVVTGFYTNILGRAPSATEIQFYAAELTNGVPASALLQQFTESPEYSNKAAPVIQGNLGNNGVTAVATVAAGGDPLAQGGAPVGGLPTAGAGATVNLTSNIDNIVGTVANSTFNGTFGSGTAGQDTLNTLDKISGVGSGNTLNIADQGDTTTGGTIPSISVSGIQTVNIQAVKGETVNTSSWTGLNTLNIAASNGADVVTAAGTTAVNVTDKLSTAGISTTVDGGSTVTVTATASTNTGVTVGDLKIGSNTAPTGAVTVTSTQTFGTGGGTQGGIAVTGGTGVTINHTINDAAGTAGGTGISASGTVGAVSITSTDNITSLTGVGSNMAAITVKGGSSINVTEAVTTTQKATGTSSVTQGAVAVTGDATTTTVSVTQAAPTGATLAVAAVSTVASVAATTKIAAQSGVDAVANSAGNGGGTPGSAAVTGSASISDGAVTISDKNAGSTTAANTITSVTLNNYGAGATINDNALATLTLSGVGGGVTITGAAGRNTPVTTLTLNLNGVSDSVGITDTQAEITTVNVVTGGTTGSAFTGGASFTDANLTTLNVSGTQKLTLAAVPASLTTLTVTGAAAFSGDISGTGITAFAPTSTGKITVTVNDTTQTFTGGAGQDVVTISADATKAITGGSATNNEVILNGHAATFTAVKTGAKVTGFTTLGVKDAVAAANDVYDMANVFKGYTSLDLVSQIAGAGSSYAFTNVAAGTSVNIKASLLGTGTVAAVEGAETNTSLLYQVAGAAGLTSGSVGITFAADTLTVTDAMLEDANANGIATLNVATTISHAHSVAVANSVTGSTTVAGFVDTISTLVDNGLSALNVSGGVGLTVAVLNEAATQASSFTLNNTSGGVLTIGTFTDANLGSLTFAGTGKDVITTLNMSGHVLGIAGTGTASESIGTLTDAALNSLTLTGTHSVSIGTLTTGVASLAITNSGTGTLSVGGTAITDAALTSLTLTGNIALGPDAGPIAAVTAGTPTYPTAAGAFGAATGVTIAGSTDNAHINLHLTGATSGTDTITVGNGNDLITDTGTATISITVGTGSDLINTQNTVTTATYSAAVTVGAHTAADTFLVGTVNAAANPNAANTVITGALTGDLVGFADNAQALAVVTVTSAQQTTISNAASLSAAITAADNLATATHDVVAFTYSGNTYILESKAIGGGTLTVNDSLIELVGVHTIAASTTFGQIAVAS